MGLYLGGLIIGRIFASEIWGGGVFSGGFILFILFIYYFFFLGGELIIGILRYNVLGIIRECEPILAFSALLLLSVLLELHFPETRIITSPPKSLLDKNKPRAYYWNFTVFPVLTQMCIRGGMQKERLRNT